jgi:hypothetical protein
MAIFKAPKLTSLQRKELVLEVSELVYDIDNKAFYGGDGSTLGGFLVSGSMAETIELNQQDIDNKFVTLAQTPLVSSAVSLTIDGGIPQINNVDFKVDGNKISWSELGLDGFLEETDVLIIQY